MGDNRRGLFDKFKVERTDGSSKPLRKHDGCDYFVLDITHDSHALPALLAYAKSCAAEYPRLASDLLKKLADKGHVGAVEVPNHNEGDGPDHECG